MTLTHADPVPADHVDRRPKIVVAIDGGAGSRAAMRWTADRSGREGARILLVTVIDPVADDAVDEAERHMLLGSGIVMDTIAEHSSVETELRRGDAAKEIIRTAEEFDADLIVIGTHATAQDEHPVLRTVPGRVAAGASCAVAVVPVGWMPAAGPALVGWSIDSAAGAAAQYAVADVRRAGGSVLLVHVWDTPVTGEIPAASGGPESIPDRQQSYLDTVGAQWRAAEPDLQVRTEVRHGRPVEQLLAAAVRARVLVVGRRARSAVTRLLLGSVSRGVLSAPPCPVVVVPAPAPGLRIAPDVAHEEL